MIDITATVDKAQGWQCSCANDGDLLYEILIPFKILIEQIKPFVAL